MSNDRFSVITNKRQNDFLSQMVDFRKSSLFGIIFFPYWGRGGGGGGDPTGDDLSLFFFPYC